MSLQNREIVIIYYMVAGKYEGRSALQIKKSFFLLGSEKN